MDGLPIPFDYSPHSVLAQTGFTSVLLLITFDSCVGSTIHSLVSQFLMQGYCGTFLVRGVSQHVQHLITNHVTLKHVSSSAIEQTYSTVCGLHRKLNSQLFHPSCCEDVVRFIVFCFSLIQHLTGCSHAYHQRQLHSSHEQFVRTRYYLEMHLH